MIAGDVQRFWSTLSIHAASAVMEIGGENESALAAAESILEQGDKITRAGSPITSQTVRDAASKASVAILQNDDSDSRVASAVAVAVIQKGTALLQEIKENKLDNKKEKQSLKSILTERNNHDNSSRTSSLTSRKSRNSSRGRKKNIMFHDMKKIRGSDSQNNRQDDNITVSSISTFGFKQWDKYATEKESDSERNREPVRKKTSVVDKYATDSIFLNECVSTESSHTSGEPSQYSTDQSTIATESYHCLEKHSSPRKKEEDSLIPKYFSTAVGSLSSYNITKKVDSLAVVNAGASDISSMRRKEEELERKHAEFSAAAEALEKKIALAVAALEESGSSKTPKLVPDNVESNDIKTPRVSNRGGSTSTTKKKKPGVSNYYVASTATKKKTSRASNYGDKSTKADRTLQELTITTHANDNSIDDELTTPTGNQLQGRSVFGSTYGLFRIAEDTTEDAKDDTSRISDTRLQNVSDKNEGDEEKGIEDESIEVSLSKKSFKNKVKGFLQHKKKKVTWAATNAFKIIPARSNSRRMSAGKRLSQTLGRKSRGLKRRFSRSRSFDTEGSSGGRTELGHKVPELNTPPTTTNGVEVTKPLKDVDVRVVTFDDAVISAETEIPPNENSSTASGSMFSGRDSYSQASSKSGLKNYYSSPITRFLEQAFYSQPDHSIDEDTALTFSTSNSEAQSSIEAILEVDDISLVTDESYNSRKSHSTKGSGSK
eukprot:scaffold3535_cov148-Skeletonema_menzelii.AAC.1